MSKVKAVVGGGLALVVVALLLTLSGSPISVAATNTRTFQLIATVSHSFEACQPGETLPRGTTAIRLNAFAGVGPRVVVKVLENGRAITHGLHPTAWTGGVVTVPVAALRTARAGVTLCYAFHLNGGETIFLNGEPTQTLAAQTANGPMAGRLRVEYLRPASSSWFSIAPEVARRMGLGHAWPGTWSVILAALLVVAVTVLSSGLAVKELR